MLFLGWQVDGNTYITVCWLRKDIHTDLVAFVYMQAQANKLKYQFIGNGHSELNFTCCIYIVHVTKKFLQFFQGIVPETEDVISKPFTAFYAWAIG